jgi:hypothetical protein
MNKLSIFSIFAIAISAFLFTFSQTGSENLFSGKEKNYPMLKPGDKIDDMVITTGAKNAYPLSAFCTPVKENDHSIRVDCSEISLCANLTIGQTFGVTDLIPASIDRDDLTWKMSMDGHPIRLEAFGVSDIVHPDLVLNPSPLRELFNAGIIWNVVIKNPTPGTHTVQGQAQSHAGADIYTWVVNFTIANPSQTALSQNQHYLELYHYLSRYK